MKKLYEIIGQKQLKGDVGIEIEVEGRGLTSDVDLRWVASNDGSLRGDNREYILAKPLSVPEAKDALAALVINLKNAGSKPVFSFRTSVHVHVNVQDLTFNQYLSMIYTYFLLEEPLMTFCGKERKGNRFCLRMQDAEGMVEVIQRLFRDSLRPGDALFGIPRDQIRYSAINLEATQKFGSLEFRGMRGNLDVELIGQWCEILVSIREFAKTIDNPMEVYELYAKQEAAGFMTHVLGENAAKLYYPKVAKDMQRSFSLSLDLPYAFAEGLKVVKEVVKAKKDVDLRNLIKPMGMPQFGFANAIQEGQAIDAAPRARINPYHFHADDALVGLREEYRIAEVKMPKTLIDELEKREL